MKAMHHLCSDIRCPTASGACLISHVYIRIGRLEVIAQRETVNYTLRVTREDDGEVIVALPFISLTFNTHRKFAAS